ncbi:hypothetical protein I9W82_002473 [Candida metapsilosis]|uniref:Uncharacterized protein n=1 Tax=Candida metapsilosis TaxID=273372 RepID=A0A8H8DCR7_9ASCO|nr:hypothetical protein I9W82_002473 [Candida metapsilosis]
MSLLQSTVNIPKRYEQHQRPRSQGQGQSMVGGNRGVLSATSPNKINVQSNITTASPFESVKLKPVPSPLKPKKPSPSQEHGHKLPKGSTEKGPSSASTTSSPLKPININNSGATTTNTTTPFKRDPWKNRTPTKPATDHTATTFEEQRDKLLSQYSAKQEQIKHYQQKLSHKQLQLLEIESQLQELNASQISQTTQQNSSIPLDVYKQASIETERQLAATTNQLKIVDLDKTPSPLKVVTPLKHTLLKQTSFITSAIDECCTTVGKQASMIFNNGNSDDEKNIFVKPQFKSDKFESLTRQTSQFFDNLLSVRDRNFDSFDEKDEDYMNAHESFDIDNLEADVVYEEVDIDDYDSSFD